VLRPSSDKVERARPQAPAPPPGTARDHLDVPLGVDTMRGLGTMLGTCCAIVMDETRRRWCAPPRTSCCSTRTSPAGSARPAARAARGWRGSARKFAEGKRDARGPRHPPRRGQQHHGQHDLRARATARPCRCSASSSCFATSSRRPSGASPPHIVGGGSREPVFDP
jgi:hypothetical protein